MKPQAICVGHRADVANAIAHLASIWILSLWVVCPATLAVDCQGNGLEDADDISLGNSLDCNENSVPDECEQSFFRFGVRSAGVPVSIRPTSLVSGDFDGDGLPDFAALSQSTSELSFFFNSEEGTFSATGPVAIGGERPGALTAVDLNRDELDDLVTANRFSNDISVVLSTGGGSFADAEHYGGGMSPISAAPEDIDGDGHIDLVVANRRSASFSVFWNSGDGTFSESSEFPAGSSPLSVDAVDLNNDTHPDVIVGNSDGVAVALSLGDRRFSEATLFSTLRRQAAVVAGDLNGDSHVDLISSSGVNLFFFTGDGTGDFVLSKTTPLERRLLQMQTLDVNGNGSLDLLSLNLDSRRAFTLFQNDGRGNFFRSDSSTTIQGTSAVTPADLDLDGDQDLATISANGGLLIYWNDEPNSVTYITQAYRIGVEDNASEPHGGAVGDVNGDGFPDVVTVTGYTQTLNVQINKGDGSFSTDEEVGVYPIGSTYRSDYVSLGDIDRDGDLDAVIANGRILLNDGTGVFQRRVQFVVPALPNQTLFVANADMDGDRILDLITTTEQAQIATVHKGAGDGTFPSSVELSIGGFARRAAVGDVNGSGLPDIVVTNGSSNAVAVFLNLGNMQFSAGFEYPLAGFPRDVALDDVDGDRTLDILTMYSSGFVVLFNNGSGAFERTTISPLFQPPNAITTGDVDNDGDLDVAIANTTGDVTILLGDGRGSFTDGRATTFGAGTEPRVIMSADFNLDGEIDIVTANRQSFSIAVFLSPSPPAFLGSHLETICTDFDFQSVSIPSGSLAADRIAKYIAPVDPTDEALLPTVFQNARLFELHQEFLATIFADRFPGLDGPGYDALTGRRASRQYYVGTIEKLRTSSGPVYGASVAVSPGPEELLEVNEVANVLQTLRSSFDLEPLGYLPDTPEAEEAALSWIDPEFEVYFKDNITQLGGGFSAYTPGVAFGTVRLLGFDGFPSIDDQTPICFGDILVLSRAPRDIEGVVAGLITSEPQGELSHLRVRMARRGTPNVFTGGAFERFADFEGKLVRVEITLDDVVVREATREEADEFISANRPTLPTLPQIDPDFSELASLTEINEIIGNGSTPVPRFGGKASNLARLQQLLTGEFQQYKERGFAIPMHHYLQFMHSNTIPSSLDQRLVTYNEYLNELFAAPQFQNECDSRFDQLTAFREFARDHGEVDPQLISELVDRIREVFPDLDTMVRFRSSSNMEDSLEFNGAGLYESTSVCALDQIDPDDSGPSRCDHDQPSERRITRALKKVWTSLWTFRAFEERAFFDINQERAAMGLLVSRRFKNERANGVAFTGNPSNPLDRRFLVAVQVGENSVVSPDPGVLAERDLIEVSEDGQVLEIVRPITGSTLLPPGEWVLSDDELRELGRLLWHINQNFPTDPGEHSRDDVLLDIEFKFEEDGNLAVKQVRPFLITTPRPPTPTFELNIPPGTPSCGAFVVAREPHDEYELKTQLHFVSDPIVLATDRERFSGELFDEVLIGPEQEVAMAESPGRFTVRRLPEGGDVTRYRFSFEQAFSLASGETFDLKLKSLDYRAVDEDPIQFSRQFNEEFLIRELVLEGGPFDNLFTRYRSCSYDTLPLFTIDIDLDDGTSLQLIERLELPTEINLTGPANLVRAHVQIGDQRQVVASYWDLVYSAFRHNTFVRYWVILDDSVEVPGAASPVYAIEIIAPEDFAGQVVTEEVHYLDDNFQVIGTPAIVSYSKAPFDGPLESLFQRGDVVVDGTITIADVVFGLEYLFGRGPAPSCRKTLDSNDDGALNIVDPITTLRALFAGGIAIPGADKCGLDPTPDPLTCLEYRLCD